MNQLKVGVEVFSIHHNDGKAHPTHYWLESEGHVDAVWNTPHKMVGWGRNCQYDFSEKQFLAPSSDGFCYYMAALPNMEQYKDGDYYKVPAQVLLDHMKSYKSPWEVEQVEKKMMERPRKTDEEYVSSFMDMARAITETRKK